MKFAAILIRSLTLAALGAGLWWAQTSPAPRGPALPAVTLLPDVGPSLLDRRLATAAYAVIHEKLRQLGETKTGDATARDKLLAALGATLTDDNAPDIILALAPEELASPFGAMVLERWLKTDPTAAADWIAAQSDATDMHVLLVARKLAEDPAALREYCEDLPDGDWKQRLVADAGRELATTNPAEAISLAGLLDAGSAQRDLLETAAYAWAARNPRDALGWINTVADPALREQLSALGAKAIAVTDPELATEWLASTVKSAPLASDTALCLAENWVARDPAKAAAWVAQLGENPSRTVALETVARRWLEADFDAAFRWVQTLPERKKILASLSADDSDPGDPGV